MLAHYTSDIRAVFLHYCQLDSKFTEHWPPSMGLAQWNLYCKDTGTSGKEVSHVLSNFYQMFKQIFTLSITLCILYLMTICVLHTRQYRHIYLCLLSDPRASSRPGGTPMVSPADCETIFLRYARHPSGGVAQQQV